MKKAKIKMFSLTWEIGDFVQNVSDLDACINKFAGVWSKKMAVQNNPKHFLPKRFFPKYFIKNIYIFWYKYCAYHKKKDKNSHWFCLTCGAVYNSFFNNIGLLVLINKDIQKRGIEELSSFNYYWSN